MDKICYIICGGPESCNSVEIPTNAFVICADSGYDKALAAGITPNLVLGDFDSVKADLPSNCEVIKAPPHKDDTDTILAVKLAILRGYKNFTLVSAIGGRTDHSLANLATLFYIAENGCIGRIVGDDNDAYYLCNSVLTLKSDKSRYISVFSVSQATLISIEGAEYPLDCYKLKRNYPLGVSNEFTDSDCIITVHSGEAVVMTVRK